MTVYEQFSVLVIFIASGLVIGCSLETFRRLSRIWRRNVFFIYLGEVIFWLIQTSWVYYVLWRVNDGILRIYFLLAIWTGYLLYTILLKKIYRKLLEQMISLVQIFLLILFTICRILFLWPLLLLYRIVIYVLRSLFICIKWLIPKKVYENISQIGLKYSTILNKYMNFRSNDKGGNDSGTK